MDQQRILPPGPPGQAVGQFRVDTEDRLGIGFRLIDGGIGGRIDDQVGLQTLQQPFHRIEVAEVLLQRLTGSARRSAIHTGDIAHPGQHRAKFAPELTRRAGQQDFHDATRAPNRGSRSAGMSASLGALASFADKLPPSSGHFMPRSGSFQAMARSYSA